MPYLPNEVLNLIFSYREVNPTAQFIKDAFKNYTDKDTDGDENVFHCFFLDYCMSYKREKNKILEFVKCDTEEQLLKQWDKYNFVSYELDLYNSLCFNNHMINEEFFHIQRAVKCNYSDYYNKYTVDMFNGNNPIIHRKKNVKPIFLPYLNSFNICNSNQRKAMDNEIMIDVLNNLQPDEYDDYIL